MTGDSFFEEMTEQSEVKSVIVEKYFWSWAKIMSGRSRSGKIAYVDLFAGPGRYKNGKSSTPLKVLETAIADPRLCNTLVTLFNDKNADSTTNLEAAINSLPDVDRLKHRPRVMNTEVNEELVAMFENATLVPTFCFIDPWGYKGLSLRLVNSVVKDWGCDCVFFFNYNRVNMGLSNPYVKEHMAALFGVERVESLRKLLSNKRPFERENIIINELGEALREEGARYVLPFRFRSAIGERTSHYLFFISKHVRGYSIMKDIMYRQSSEHQDGVASFEYTPVQDKQLSFLYGYSRPLDRLGDALLEHFSGRRLTVGEVFEQHHVGTPYVKRNYKDALKRLEEANKILVNAGDKPRRKGTLADRLIVQFPNR